MNEYNSSFEDKENTEMASHNIVFRNTVLPSRMVILVVSELCLPVIVLCFAKYLVPVPITLKAEAVCCSYLQNLYPLNALLFFA